MVVRNAKSVRTTCFQTPRIRVVKENSPEVVFLRKALRGVLWSSRVLATLGVLLGAFAVYLYRYDYNHFLAIASVTTAVAAAAASLCRGFAYLAATGSVSVFANAVVCAWLWWGTDLTTTEASAATLALAAGLAMLWRAFDNRAAPTKALVLEGLPSVELPTDGQSLSDRRGVVFVGGEEIMESEVDAELLVGQAMKENPGLGAVVLRGRWAAEEVERFANAAREFGLLVAMEIERNKGNTWYSVRYPRTPIYDWRWRTKEVLEYLIAIAAIVVLLPVMAAAAVAIRVDSKGPVLFKQWRTGFRGMRVRCLKFRTMIAGADRLKGNLGHINEMVGTSHLFKATNDPRVTRVGRVLRRASIDELPQLFNVLKGDINLLGPRLLSVPIEAYEWRWLRRLSVPPGIGCLWQARHREKTNFRRWMQLDIWYISKWSPWLDMRLVVELIFAVVSGRGAR